MPDQFDPEPLAAADPPRLDLFMTVIRVTSWRSTVGWYIRTLGLAPILLDSQHEFALLAAGTGRLGLQGVKEARSAAATGSGRVRMVFQVFDLDAERQRLIEQGVNVGEPIENLEEGYREVRLQDPEGCSLRLFAWTDPARGNPFARHRS